MSDITLDIFDGSGFRAATLSNWVNRQVPFIPGLVGSLPNMFVGEGVTTLSVEFDEEDGSLTLIPTTPRGAPPSSTLNPKGTLRTFKAVHLAREAALTADQVSSIRVLGEAGVLKTAQDLVYSRIEGPWGLKAQMGLTLEHMYLGAVNGQVYDADNATLLYDYFALFGKSRPAATTLACSTSTSTSGAIAKQLTGVKRAAVRALNGLDLSQAIPIALCDDNFYDAVWSAAEIVNARRTGAVGAGKNSAIEQISNNGAFDSFVYNKVLFINYRGSDQAGGTNDGQVAVPANQALFFYAGVPGLFQCFFAPADTWEFVNTKGLPSYLIQRRERQTESARVFELQSNPLPMNMRPLHVQQLDFS